MKKSTKQQQVELDELKKKTWKDFQQKDWDALDDDMKMLAVEKLYSVMHTQLEGESIILPYHFWKEYENTDEIRPIEKFIASVNDILANMPKTPSAEIWLSRERGILPRLKAEWVELTNPFKNEKLIEKKMMEKARIFLSTPKNHQANINITQSTKEAVVNIDKALYQPTAKKLNRLEEKIKKIATP